MISISENPEGDFHYFRRRTLLLKTCGMAMESFLFRNDSHGFEGSLFSRPSLSETQRKKPWPHDHGLKIYCFRSGIRLRSGSNGGKRTL
jgi:hypothetical protein